MSDKDTTEAIPTDQFVSLLFALKEDAQHQIDETDASYEEVRLSLFGKESELTRLTQFMRLVPKEDKQRVGIVLNQVKQSLEQLLSKKAKESGMANEDWMDVTAPGIRPPVGHLHVVTQAIEEITAIFNKLGFTRVRHPEVDWDWYPFESLNMPHSHPASDEWETFFIRGQKTESREQKYQNIVLTPHTSNGQVREMEKGILPIRMINIAKCYRRQIDVSHTPMFHQFEGLYIDKNVSIGHLKGVLDYFAKAFFGKNRKTRIRPFHFQFTEPSFEVDISCGICDGKGCRLCKEGWLELGGAGMVHPVVLKNGNVDTTIYNGFAFGWGVERSFMMKSGTQLDDIRLLYSNDVRFLEQF
jgi:phenylalanyl-tRNA synthetase alpha chain